MSNSFYQALLMDDPEHPPPEPVSNCELDTYFTCGPDNDPYWDNVVLFLKGEGSHGSTTFTDSSSYARTQVAGATNVQITTANKKFGNASIQATASTAYLAYAGTTLGREQVFTIEFWVYFPTTITGTAYFFGLNAGIYIDINGTAIGQGTGWGTAGTGALGTAVWRHVALVRENGIGKTYVDGVYVNQNTNGVINDSGSVTLAIYGIPSRPDLSAPQILFDEFRFTKGIARYRGNFSIPTSAFPNAKEIGWVDARTVLLTHADATQERATFVPGVTTNGLDTVVPYAAATFRDAAAVSFGPSGATFTVDNTDNSISYSNAKLSTSGLLKFKLSANVQIAGTPSGTGDAVSFLVYGTGTSQAGFAFRSVSGVIQLWTYAYFGIDFSQHTGTMSASALYELEVINNTTYWKVDGTTIRTFAGNAPSTTTVFFGPVNGNPAGISSLIISNPTVNKYSVADAACYQPKLLDFYGFADTSTEQPKFGTRSIKFTNNGSSNQDRVLINSHHDFSLDALDFTIELWAYHIRGGTGSRYLARTSGTHNIAWHVTAGTGTLNTSVVTSAGTRTLAPGPSTATLASSGWSHVVLQRRGGTQLETYIDGVLAQSVTITSAETINLTSDWIIGAFATVGSSDANRWNGYLDEIRITRGVARYTSTFTPATQPYCGEGDIASIPTSGSNPLTKNTITAQTGSLQLLAYYAPLTSQQVATNTGAIASLDILLPSFAGDGSIINTVRFFNKTVEQFYYNRGELIVGAQLSFQVNGTGFCSGIGAYPFAHAPVDSDRSITHFNWYPTAPQTGIGSNYEFRFSVIENLQSMSIASIDSTKPLGTWEVPEASQVALRLRLPQFFSYNTIYSARIQIDIQPTSTNPNFGNPNFSITAFRTLSIYVFS